MDERHVALFCSEQLLGESLVHLLEHIGDIVLIGPWLIDEQALENLARQVPDIVLVADGEPSSEKAAVLATQILDTYSDLSVIRITLAQNVAHIYTSRSMPARSADLLDAIRRLPSQEPRIQDLKTQADLNQSTGSEQEQRV